MKDINGREYLKRSDATKGLEIEVDGDFTCVEPNSVHTLYEGKDGFLSFPCKMGGHALSGQLQNGYFIGVYPAPPTEQGGPK